jgi:hypothetical protein
MTHQESEQGLFIVSPSFRMLVPRRGAGEAIYIVHPYFGRLDSTMTAHPDSTSALGVIEQFGHYMARTIQAGTVADEAIHVERSGGATYAAAQTLESLIDLLYLLDNRFIDADVFDEAVERIGVSNMIGQPVAHIARKKSDTSPS